MSYNPNISQFIFSVFLLLVSSVFNYLYSNVISSIQIDNTRCNAILVKSSNLSKIDKLFIVTAGHCALPLLNYVHAKNIFITVENMTFMRTIKEAPIFASANFKAKAVPLLLNPTDENKLKFFTEHYLDDTVIIPLEKQLIRTFNSVLSFQDPLEEYSFTPDIFINPATLNTTNVLFKFKNEIEEFSVEKMIFQNEFSDSQNNINVGESGSPLLIKNSKGVFIIGFASGFTSNKEKTIKYNKFSAWNEKLQAEIL